MSPAYTNAIWLAEIAGYRNIRASTCAEAGLAKASSAQIATVGSGSLESSLDNSVSSTSRGRFMTGILSQSHPVWEWVIFLISLSF